MLSRKHGTLTPVETLAMNAPAPMTATLTE
jgi:hypothetical protein